MNHISGLRSHVVNAQRAFTTASGTFPLRIVNRRFIGVHKADWKKRVPKRSRCLTTKPAQESLSSRYSIREERIVLEYSDPCKPNATSLYDYPSHLKYIDTVVK